MLFCTVQYGIFFSAVLVAAWLLRRRVPARNAVLLLASYYFYACWSGRCLALILFSTLLDYTVGLLLEREHRGRHRRRLIAASLIGNLGVLGVFKYYGFFAESFRALGRQLGVEVGQVTLDLVLPLGISFYTFQTLSYTIDVYRRRIRATRNLVDFALFVAFFPQLVAGPIVRASHLLPQLRRPPTLDTERWNYGLLCIGTGLFKKIVIADYLGAHLVDRVYAHPTGFGTLDTLAAVYGYALQVYGDFAGYSDIAIGSAALLGFDIPANFAAPYRAANLREYWQRWHISLSTWLRDYLYIPLGGSRRSAPRTYLNLMTTMVLGGLWHGAAWTFVAWGAMHGVALAVTRAVQRWRDRPGGARCRPTWARLLAVVVTFHAVCLGLVLFRAPSFAAAGEVLAALGRWSAPSTLVTGPVLLVLLAGALTHATPARWDGLARRWFGRWPIPAQAVAVVFALALFRIMAETNRPFIYFQF